MKFTTLPFALALLALPLSSGSFASPIGRPMICSWTSIASSPSRASRAG